MPEPGASEKLKVFISYSRRDASEFADELVAGLEYGGFAPFLDRHDIAAGEDWEARLSGLIAHYAAYALFTIAMLWRLYAAANLNRSDCACSHRAMACGPSIRFCARSIAKPMLSPISSRHSNASTIPELCLKRLKRGDSAGAIFGAWKRAALSKP